MDRSDSARAAASDSCSINENVQRCSVAALGRPVTEALPESKAKPASHVAANNLY